MAIARSIRQSLVSASLIRKVADEALILKASGLGPIYDFSLGNPILEPPEAFREALQAFARHPPPGSHRYMQNVGYPAIREAVAASLAAEYKQPFQKEHIAMTVGAAGGINLVLKTLLDPGDEVIFLSPYFVEYGFYVSNHQGVSVIVPTDGDFQPDLAAIEAALTPKTKILLLNTPNNPTGVVYTADILSRLADLLRRHKAKTGQTVYLLNDSPYRRLFYDIDAVPEPLEWYEDAILATSFSKDLSLPGERIGYIAIAPACQDTQDILEGLAFSSRVLGFVNAPALMQHLLPSLLQAKIDLSWYQRRRDLLLRSLRQIGYHVPQPNGAFYLFPQAPGGDDIAFCKALRDHRVLVVPGSGFGTPGYFRIAYCVEEETLQNALPAFENVFRAFSLPQGALV